LKSLLRWKSIAGQGCDEVLGLDICHMLLYCTQFYVVSLFSCISFYTFKYAKPHTAL